MIDAIYFDGKTTRGRPVTMVLHQRVAAIRGEGIRENIRLSKIAVSERLDHAPRILSLPNGACLHVEDARLDRLLAKNGYIEPRVVRWQRNWKWSLLALVMLIVTLLSAYQWGLPWAADRIARHLPLSVEKRIGDAQLKMIEEEWMQPSKLDPIDQARLQQKFAAMLQPRGEKIAYRLEFRYSTIGPNALALANGTIIMTDQLAMLARNDEAVLGVLAHELGHLQHRHSLRQLLQAVGVTVLVNLWVGDVSAVLATVPTILLDQKHSRDFEREADRYAVEMLKLNGMPAAPVANLFEKMHRVAYDGRAADERDGKVWEYFSSHPSDKERIEALRAADRGR